MSLKEKEAELRKLRVKLSRVRKSFKSNPEWVKLNDERKLVQKEQRRVMQKEEKVAKEILFNFTGNGHYPYYSRGTTYTYGTSTNILPDVLDAIKEEVKAPSKLRGSDIEDIVRKLVRIETANHPTYPKLHARRVELSQEESDLYVKKRQIEDAIEQPVLAKMALVRQELTQLRAQTVGTREQKKSKLLSFRANASSDETVAKIHTILKLNRALDKPTKSSPYKPLV